MTAMRRYVDRIFWMAAGALLGAVVVGFAVGHTWVMPAHTMTTYMSVRNVELEALLRYHFANTEVAKESLEVYIEALRLNADELQRAEPHFFSQRLALAYARLALLTERAGDAEGRDRYFKLAQQAYAATSTGILTEELREAVRAADVAWEEDIRTKVAMRHPARKAASGQY